MVQTFLPYSDFEWSAKILDRQRLGKQRVEAYQILRALAGVSKGWVNHPATRMWSGSETTLIAYTVTVCREWQLRGYKDSVLDKVLSMRGQFPGGPVPSWLGDPQVHLSHQSNLVRKFPEHYGPFFPDADPTLPYYWPGGK